MTEDRETPSGDSERPKDDSLPALVQRLSEAQDGEGTPALLGRLTRSLTASARKAGVVGVAGGRWLADTLLQVAPRLSVRDLDTLRDHHHGLTGEALADALVENAVRATMGVGAAAGGLAAVEFTAPPLLLTAPAQIAAETLAVSAIEVKLVAELHEVYGVQVPGNGTQRATAFVHAWARQRGVDPKHPGSYSSALGTTARRELRNRLMRRMGRGIATLGPMLTGAAAGAALNNQATRRVADVVREDLRHRVTLQR
ncbi:MAG: hypothetical protein ACRDN9_16260 [Streptosporangiaceae bacterium]